jgi:ATP-dependent Clp protease ATP-binding subunit ClpA
LACSRSAIGASSSTRSRRCASARDRGLLQRRTARGEGRAEGRFEARQTTGLTPLVGREEEIALLVRLWRQATNGNGQVVLLAGEPGIGKSRLIRELRWLTVGSSVIPSAWLSRSRLRNCCT